ncbi:MAG: hypothetical protein DI607_01485, partial [Sphingomonas hengshuiensis]
MDAAPLASPPRRRHPFRVDLRAAKGAKRDQMDGTTPQHLADAAPAQAPRSEWRQTIGFLLKLAIIFTALRSFAFAPFMIPSASMMPGLLVGD